MIYQAVAVSTRLWRENNMHRICVFLVILMLATGAGAQEKRVVTGTVTETGGNAVGGVVVKALGDAGKMLGFATSTPKGAYRIRIPVDAKGVRVQFTAMGFATDTVPLPDGADKLDAVLLPAAFELPEVKAQLPAIRSKGDTLKYSVDAFKSGSDRTIEDVIRKLPGVEVSGDGTISYQGRSIKNFYIEGLDMLNGRYSLATRNVKPDDIATVDIYEHHQAQRVLKGIVPSEEAAMNLTLKNKSMLRPIGNAKIGGGAGADGSGLWLGELFTMLIGPGSQMMVTAKGNNAGSTYGSELKNHIEDSGDQFTPASGIFPALPFGSAPLPGNRYLQNRSAGASANAAWKLGETKTISAWADYTGDRNSFSNTETIDYAGVAEPLSHFHQEVTNHLRSDNLNGQFSYEDNSKTLFIDEKLLFNAAFMRNRYGVVSTAENVTQKVRSDEYNLSNSLEATLRSGRKIWRVKSKFSLGNSPVGLLTGYDAETAALFLSQSAKGTRFYTEETANCSWALGTRWVLGVEAGFMADWSDMRSLREGVPPQDNNDDSGYKLQASLSPTFQWMPGARTTVTFRVPVKAWFLRYIDLLNGAHYPMQKADFDAHARISHRFSGLLNAALSIYEETDLGGIRDFVTNPIFQTYREASSSGMGALSQSRRWGAYTSWRWRNPIHGIFFSLLGDVSTGTQNSMATSEIESGEVISGRENLQNHMNIALGTFSGAKHFAAAKTTLKGSLTTTWMSSESMRQALKMKVENLSWRFSIGVQSSLWRDIVNVDASAGYTLTTQTIGVIDSRTNLSSVDARGRIALRPTGNWEIWCRPSYTGQEMATAGYQNYFFLDAGSRLTIKRVVELELQARNLTDRRLYSYSDFAGADLYAWSFNLRPLEILLTLKYSF